MSQSQAAHLVLMANQIAANNSYGDDIEQTASVVFAHVKKFWARSMKQQIVEYAKTDSRDMNPAVKRAVELLAMDS